MKQLTLFALGLLLATSSFAQDIILLTNGDTLHCKILNAGAYDITYEQNGVKGRVESKNFISYAKDFNNRVDAKIANPTQAPPNSNLTKSVLTKSDLSAGDHLIKSGKFRLVALVVSLTGAIIVGATLSNDPSTAQILGIGAAVPALGFSFASIYHTIKAGKKLNDTTLPN